MSTLKKVTGWCLIAAWLIWVVADTFHDFYVDFGWWSLALTPIALLAIVAIISFISWLID